MGEDFVISFKLYNILEYINVVLYIGITEVQETITLKSTDGGIHQHIGIISTLNFKYDVNFVYQTFTHRREKLT